MTKRLFSPLALIAALLLMLSACGSSSSEGEAPGGGKLITAGTLTVCSDVPYAPFEEFDKSAKSGFKGFDIDIVQHIADELDLKLKVKDSSFDALQSGLALNSGDCDLVASAMTITPERAKKLIFSDPYYASMQSLLVPKGSSIKSINDLKGKKVGVQKGTTGKDYATEHAKGAKIIDFPSDGEMWQAIQGGSVDALLQDLPVNLTHTESGDFVIVETFDTGENYGLAIQKDNQKLADKINAILAEFRSDGGYQTTYDKYFATN
jgi:polar amino acid transport system substrate-binding protein